ncbi:MAG: AAA family ATPase [Bacteroidetes bacterium]|nr:AAA family ATPase [Bacteroidota bacterium]
MIKEVIIENFKGFKGRFVLPLNKGLNILVGNNEAGKSTIIEAINLALTGMMSGRYIKNELTQYLFNNDVLDEYIASLQTDSPKALPHILIEVLFEDESYPELEGTGNTYDRSESGICLKIEFDTKYQEEYEALIKEGDIKTIPIEYYDFTWTSCARGNITPRGIPIKAALIDSSGMRYQNGSDVYISRIVKDYLSTEDVVAITQAHRRMRESFIGETVIKEVNAKIKEAAKISDKAVSLSVDLSVKNAWENNLTTYLDNVPFHHIGKGEQCIIKTKLALSHQKTVEANVLLLEEPENHLSHVKLNHLLSYIKSNSEGKQVIISTHSSFVANKLGLESLIFLNNKKTMRLNDLEKDTKEFFEKLSGYDTLRLILCEKAILVEGDSDELVVQRAYMDNNDGMLPIEKGIDVISVGTSFLRFLEIAAKLKKALVVVTDNDGNLEAVKKKYEKYLPDAATYISSIRICFDEIIDNGNLNVHGGSFNYNTLEPKMVKANGLDKMNKILGLDLSEDNLHVHMRANKTACALKVLKTTEQVSYPQYILDAITEP